MIVFIEGPRASGKTHLLNEFFKRNKDQNIIYYKFAFAKYIDSLGIRDQESGPGVHYFSIANVMTILELNKTLFKDKIIVFDRSIFSAYVWSIYRNRMDRERLLSEFESILKSELYENCCLCYFTKGSSIPDKIREEKDYFGNFENYSAEEKVFNEVLARTQKYYSDSTKGNQFIKFTNEFDDSSIDRFYDLITGLALPAELSNK